MIFGQIPQGDIQLEDGRVLHTQKKPEPNVHGWMTDDGLVVLATMDGSTVVPLHLHVHIAYGDHPPSKRDIALVRKVFFGKDPVSMKQSRGDLRRNPNHFNIVHAGYLPWWRRFFH